MRFNVEVEKPSSILRKLTIKVPADIVETRWEKGLVEVQRTAKLKGFRPGQVPISMIKQFYGEDVRHRVFHNLIDESFEEAVKEHKLQAVGRPKIDTSNHKTGEGQHDHAVKEGQDLTFVATVEVMPEVQVKNYTGVSVTREKVEISDDEIEKVVQNLLDSQSQLIPAEASHVIEKGDYVDVQFAGGLIEDSKVVPRDDMKGSRVLEVGGNTMIPGFEDQLIGLKAGESKTFRIHFPEDFQVEVFKGKEAEFQVTANDVKQKKQPILNDEFAKEVGYQDLNDLRSKAKEYLLKERTEDSDRKVRSELLSALIEKNGFEVPMALIENQTRNLAQEWAQELKNQRVSEKGIQDALMSEIEFIKKRAESQVRASLILEAIAKAEEIEVSAADIDQEISHLSQSMKVGETELKEFYAKNPGRKDDLEFRLRQERTVKFLLDKAKVKWVDPAKDKKQG